MNEPTNEQIFTSKFVVDPFPKTQATPESVYLNLHTNNDKKKIRWLGACQVEAVNNKN